MSQQFCPRLSEAIGSKVLSLDQLFHTRSNLDFRILHLVHLAHIYLIYGGKLHKIFIIPQKTGGFCT